MEYFCWVCLSASRSNEILTDNYRVEIEARFPTGAAAAVVLERNKDSRHSEMGLYGGDPVLKKL